MGSLHSFKWEIRDLIKNLCLSVFDQKGSILD